MGVSSRPGMGCEARPKKKMMLRLDGIQQLFNGMQERENGGAIMMNALMQSNFPLAGKRKHCGRVVPSSSTGVKILGKSF
jgi:hypothetical protein